LWQYVAQGNVPFTDYEPSLLQRASARLNALIHKLGRQRHRWLIIILLLINAVSSLAVLIFFAWVAISPTATRDDLLAWMIAQAQQADAGGLVVQWVHAGLEILVGAVALVAAIAIMLRREKFGVMLALIEGVLALTVLQVVTFYMDQFTAVVPTFFQLLILFFVSVYYKWYLLDSPGKAQAYFRLHRRH